MAVFVEICTLFQINMGKMDFHILANPCIDVSSGKFVGFSKID
jgi:hypothetical protein